MVEGPRNNRAYLDHLRSRGCLLCSSMEPDIHHMLRKGTRGVALKSEDRWAVPLCHYHHMELHKMGNENKFWLIHAFDAVAWAEEEWKHWVGEHG